MATKDTKKNTVTNKSEKKQVKTKSKFGLGQGLNTLIPTFEDKPKEEKAKDKEENNSGIVTININSIEPNPNQPRKKFDEDALGELAESIKQHGLIQPIVVQKAGKMYQIVAGERRWRACRIAKIKEVPVIIKDLSNP